MLQNLIDEIIIAENEAAAIIKNAELEAKAFIISFEENAKKNKEAAIKKQDEDNKKSLSYTTKKVSSDLEKAIITATEKAAIIEKKSNANMNKAIDKIIKAII